MDVWMEVSKIIEENCSIQEKVGIDYGMRNKLQYVCR